MKYYMKARQRKARTILRLFYAECFLTSNICRKTTTETEQYTKYTRLRKGLTHIYKKIMSFLIEKIYY